MAERTGNLAEESEKDISIKQLSSILLAFASKSYLVKWLIIYLAVLVPQVLLVIFWIHLVPPFEVLSTFAFLYLVISLVLIYPLIKEGEEKKEKDNR